MGEQERWQAVCLRLMVEVGNMTQFPNLETQPDRDFQVARAGAAVAVHPFHGALSFGGLRPM